MDTETKPYFTSALPKSVEVGFEGHSTKLTETQAQLLVGILMAPTEIVIPDNEKLPIMQIVQKRITGYNLPIKFTDAALLYIAILSDGNPGKAMVILIDSLQRYGNDKDVVEVTTSDLCELYPWGFYTYDSFVDYIDNYLKNRKVKYSEIY